MVNYAVSLRCALNEKSMEKLVEVESLIKYQSTKKSVKLTKGNVLTHLSLKS